jgi:hypothetical protein
MKSLERKKESGEEEIGDEERMVEANKAGDENGSPED